MRRLALTVILGVVLLAPVTEAGDFFVGGSAGQGTLRDTLGGFTIDGDDTGWKAFAGYKLMPFVFVEGSYTDLGSFDDSTQMTRIEAGVESYALFAAGNVPIGRLFSFFVKVGVGRTEADFLVEDPLETTTQSDSDTDLAWGFGFGLNLGKRFTVRAEYEGYETDTIQDLEFVSVGAQINF